MIRTENSERLYNLSNVQKIKLTRKFDVCQYPALLRTVLVLLLQ